MTFADSTISMLTAADGDIIAVIDWPLGEDVVPRGVVVLVHGLGEHIWRYRHLAAKLNAWGYTVRGYDHYGHGDSAGQRGAMPNPRRLIDDLADVIDDCARLHPGVPLFVLGHSMGGLIAADFVRQGVRQITGLILSSPAFDPGLSGVQRFMLNTVARVLPDLRVDNGLNPQYLARDPAVVADYKADKMVHRKICGRLANYIAQTGPQVIAAASGWTLPTLLLFAGQDRLVNPQGSRRFAAAAQAMLVENPVQAQEFKPMYHEIFNDPEKAQVERALQAWLDQQCKAMLERSLT
jgi:alpha-beta hydrolase superfamily lysophospholipase